MAETWQPGTPFISDASNDLTGISGTPVKGPANHFNRIPQKNMGALLKVQNFGGKKPLHSSKTLLELLFFNKPSQPGIHIHQHRGTHLFHPGGLNKTFFSGGESTIMDSIRPKENSSSPAGKHKLFSFVSGRLSQRLLTCPSNNRRSPPSAKI